MKEESYTGLSWNKFFKNNTGFMLVLALLGCLAWPHTSLAQRPDRQDHPNTQRPDREVNRSNAPDPSRSTNRNENNAPNRGSNSNQNYNNRNNLRERSNFGSYNQSPRTRTSNPNPHNYQERDLAYNYRRAARSYPPAGHYSTPGHYRSPDWNYRNLPRWGYAAPMAPRTAITIAFDGVYFHYDNGVYYRPLNGRYVVVPAPLGLRTRFIPAGHSRFYIHQQPYYYYYGTYYQLQNDYYEVVKPPGGALVESIPDGYEQIVIDGETYYIVDGVQYKPVLSNNEIWYEVLKVD